MSGVDPTPNALPPMAMASTPEHMTRLGPPGKGDVIHRSTCRYAVAHSNALRWVWADRQGFDQIEWDGLRRNGIKPCRLCHPERLVDAPRFYVYGRFDHAWGGRKFGLYDRKLIGGPVAEFLTSEVAQAEADRRNEEEGTGPA